MIVKANCNGSTQPRVGEERSSWSSSVARLSLIGRDQGNAVPFSLTTPYGRERSASTRQISLFFICASPSTEGSPHPGVTPLNDGLFWWGVIWGFTRTFILPVRWVHEVFHEVVAAPGHAPHMPSGGLAHHPHKEGRP